jgi:uncharacterized alkaline shock family protein YloU
MTENNTEERAANSAETTETSQDATIDQSNLEGKIHISEDVIAQLAIKALNSVEGVSPANPGLMANLRIGRKTVNGVRISLSEDTETPEIIVDTYISVKYGLRLPDVCWDVQEAVKEQIEKFTGYAIKGVNVYVHNITFADNKQPDEKSEPEEQPFSSFGEDA